MSAIWLRPHPVNIVWTVVMYLSDDISVLRKKRWVILPKRKCSALRNHNIPLHWLQFHFLKSWEMYVHGLLCARVCFLVYLYVWFIHISIYVHYRCTFWHRDISKESVEERNEDEGPAHYSSVMISAMASQITGVSSVYSTICSVADQRKHQSSASLAFVRGIHRWTVNSPHKGPRTRQMFPFDDVIMMSDKKIQQATGLDAWASRVKCPARFVSHLHDICIYMSCL